MTENKQYDVFLSYSFKDRAWVSQFVEGLRAAGLTAWFDVAELPPGERWQQQIQKALRESTTLVVVLSPNSVGSPWTFFELGAAVADKKRIIPVLTEEMDIRDIPVLLTQFQFLKEPSPREAGRLLAEAVTKTPAKETQSDNGANQQ